MSICLICIHELVGLRGVVNNAGVNMHGEMELMTLGLLQKVIDINFYGPVRVTKAFLPLIRKSKGSLYCFIVVMNLNLYVHCIHALTSRSPSRGPNNLFVYEQQQNLGRGLQHETGLSPE